VKYAKPYLNGVRHNAYLGGKKVWADEGQDALILTFNTQAPSATTTVSFRVFAQGSTVVAWGDGNRETFNNAGVSSLTISHTYATHGVYKAKVTGTYERVSANSTYGCFYIRDAKALITVAGGFNWLVGGRTPFNYMFRNTFYGCANLTSIPAGLFGGISGAPPLYMFQSTFQSCTGLTAIPAGLFGGISGAPAQYMFHSTFYGCSGLTGAIPAGLFGGISGAPASYMFQSTFLGCTGLTSIPAGLFGGISGEPAQYMFRTTFQDCSGLTGAIPAGLFGGISGAPALYMFHGTFYSCSGLTGPSATLPNGQKLYEAFPTATSTQVGLCYYNCTGLSDYASIPTAWK
jgi:hypothetical protein